ncbi:hypothetical protein [Nostoc sp.]
MAATQTKPTFVGSFFLFSTRRCAIAEALMLKTLNQCLIPV